MLAKKRMIRILSHWYQVIAFVISPVDSSNPGGIQQGELCSLVSCNGILGKLKFVFWVAVSITLAMLLANL